MTRAAVLDALLDDHDAYLRLDSSADASMFYLTGFEAGDRFALLRLPGESVLLVPQLEVGRARRESHADTVRSYGEFVDADVRGDTEAELDVVVAFLDEYDLDSLAVPREFHVYDAERLVRAGYGISPVPDVVMDARVRKDETEVEHLRAAQRVTEDAMAVAERLLGEASVEDGVLHHGNEVLTAERVRSAVEIALLERGCHTEATIVAPGAGGADPHWLGEGPIHAGVPVVVDIFPEHPSHYHGDMTRTFVRGEPTEAVRAMYDATLNAQEAAFDVLAAGAGVSGAAVHDAVCDTFEERGYATIRQGAEEGFIHSTGHAIGLEVHEPPRLASGCGDLPAGAALTIEPGLYVEGVGGVRIEDMVVVIDDGFENLNDYHKTLVPDPTA
jgi:Xaa-Pro aminopeptidase